MLLGKTRHWARLAVCFASGECPTILARGLYFTQNHRVIITKIMCVDLYYIHIHTHSHICMYAHKYIYMPDNIYTFDMYAHKGSFN